MVYLAHCSHCGNTEVEKPMTAAFPTRHSCGGKLTRRYTVPSVIYAVPGFYSTDVTRFKSQVGAERFAKFEKERDDIERRAKAGKLTSYEKALE